MNQACVCKKLGGWQAMSLDGGSSSALYGDGRTLTPPGRKLSNLLVVYATRAQYRAAREQLIPFATPVLARLDTPAPSTSWTLPTPATPAKTVITAENLPPVFVTPPPSGVTASPVRLLTPDLAGTLHGVAPILATVGDVARYGWSTIKINGTLRAMSTEHTLRYQWDTTPEGNGETTIEISVWSSQSDLLAQEVRKVMIDNSGDQ